MMNKWKRLLALTLAMLMLASLFAGCKPKETDSASPDSATGDKTNPATPSGETDSAVPEYVYTSKFSTISLDGFKPASEDGGYGINSLIWSGDRFYCTVYTYGSEVVLNEETGEETQEWFNRSGLYTMDADGSNLHELENYAPLAVPEGWEGGSNISNVLPAAEGLYVLEQVNTYRYNLPEDFDPMEDEQWNYYEEGENIWCLRHLDATGAELSSFRLDELYERPEGEEDYFYFYVNTAMADKAGNLYFAIEQNILVLSPTGEKLFQLSGDQYINSLAQLRDGSVGYCAYNYGEGGGGGPIMYATATSSARVVDSVAPASGETGYALYIIDPETKSLKDPIVLTQDWISSLYTGTGDYDLYYVKNYSLMGLKLTNEGAESEELFNFINVDVDSSYMRALIPEEDGSFRVVSLIWDDTGDGQTCEVSTVYKALSSELPKKTTLTYACMYVDYQIRRRIIAFNKSSDSYRIEVKDYSQYNTEEDYQGGVTTLTTEILSGQVPDLFSVSSMPISRIAAKGYLEDLWPWIEQDAELGGRSGVLEPVLNAMSTGEKLYYITPAVSLVTLGGPAQLVGTEMGWTVDDLLAAYRQMPPEADIMGVGMTKEQVLQSCLIMMQDDFVNWKTGEVRFDSEEFLNLMKFADLFPETFDWEAHYGDGAEYVSDEQRLMQGLQMLQAVSIYDFNEWRVYQEMMGGDMTFIGFPAGEGTVGSAFSVDSGIAMSSTCADKAGAWEFVRYFLSYDYQKDSSWSIPTNKQLFDERLKEAMTDDYYDAYDENGNLKRDENGNVVKERSPKTSWWIDENNRIELYAMEEADCAKLMDLINATTHIYQYDETLWNIISDECAAFFAGQQSAEDAARLIQSRMNIYVNEQR